MQIVFSTAKQKEDASDDLGNVRKLLREVKHPRWGDGRLNGWVTRRKNFGK